MLPSVVATRYVTPLREGGSLPGLMEADDLGIYVVKFTGAGQGPKALVAEVVAGALAQRLGLPVPDLAVVEVDPALAANEPDEEVQHLLRASPGTNLGVDFLPGALDLDPHAFALDPAFAGRVLWFDALVGNVDRSWRNPNMLFWHGAPYLIDHGATLPVHHNWAGAAGFAARTYDAADHALLTAHPDVDAADSDLAPLVADAVRAAVDLVPAQWLPDDPVLGDHDAQRAAYVTLLSERLGARDAWLPPLREQSRQAAASRPRDEPRRSGLRAARP